MPVAGDLRALQQLHMSKMTNPDTNPVCGKRIYAGSDVVLSLSVGVWIFVPSLTLLFPSVLFVPVFCLVVALIRVIYTACGVGFVGVRQSGCGGIV